MQGISQILAEELGKQQTHIENVIKLIDEGNTIPFIARYRKEMHGAMDDTSLRTLEKRLAQLRALEDRREAILKSIEEQGKLTDELQAAIGAAATMTELEDLYAPYKKKRRTRASAAREMGLEGLAEYILSQAADCNPSAEAEKYLSEELGVESVEQALQGAQDIIAEIISDDAELRKKLRALLNQKGVISSAAATDADSPYSNYYEFSAAVSRIKGYQVLALNRGEKEEFLKVAVELDKDLSLDVIKRIYIKGITPAKEIMENVCIDAYTRLIFPSLEREIRSTLTDVAADGAIDQFALNLKPLLMQPPVKGKVTMGLDPGYRMGCKVAVVDETGKVLDTAVVYPTHGEAKKEQAINLLSALIKKHGVCSIAVGNGTAGKETEIMTAELIRRVSEEGFKAAYAVVSEAGASVYSASELAAEEFPQFDVNLRSAVSIARRLQDPLAELVKIDPKSIGVGQYQHDMPPKRLDEALNAVVEDCVNSVGVDLNTASPSLLRRVSGVDAAVSKNIVTYREENGAFTSRAQLKKVKKLGPKAFEQCAGFLRIRESKNVLDNTAVHPEAYPAAEKILALTGHSIDDVKHGKLQNLLDEVLAFGEEKLASEAGIGVFTLRDVVAELMKPGRDVRDELPPTELKSDVLDISDLKPGMTLKGTVRNVIDFGAFVDIGVHQDGLVHISQICNRFIKHPSEVLTVGDVVNVKVLEIDEAKKRISLTMRGDN